jgi:hypothetical protein
MIRQILITVGALAFPVWPANAYCSKPTPPYCATQYGTFNDQYEFDRCRSEMQFYLSDVEAYQSCLRREQEDLRRKHEEALREYNDAVESFNRRARG